MLFTKSRENFVKAFVILLCAITVDDNIIDVIVNPSQGFPKALEAVDRPYGIRLY